MKYLSLLLLLLPLGCFAQLKVQGKVVNAATGKPIPNASVFIDKTTIGTMAGADGSFLLNRLKRGQYDLVVSVVGYEKYNKTLMVTEDVVLPVIQMLPKTMMMNEVRIGGRDPSWGRKLREFKEQFLGRSSFASQCKIVNPKILTLRYSNHEMVLTGSTNDFLEINNDALGYKLKYLLKSFVLDKQAGQVAYEGSVLFEESKGTPADEQRWKRNRRNTYYGSPTDFLREVIADRADSNYMIRKFCFNRKDKVTGEFVFDTLHVKDYIHPTEQRGIFAISYPQSIEVFFYPPRRGKVFGGWLPRRMRNGGRVVAMSFIDKYVLFDSNGTILNPMGILFEHEWGLSRIAQLLPIDYWPEEQ